MDPSDTLNPRTFCTEELERRSRERLHDWTDEQLRSFNRPATAHEAAERLAAALLSQLPAALALLTEARQFADRSLRAINRPTRQNTSPAWRAAWASGFAALHGRRDELSKAHEQIATSLTAWRLKPGFGEHDTMLAKALNGMAHYLNRAAEALDIAGQTRELAEAEAA